MKELVLIILQEIISYRIFFVILQLEFDFWELSQQFSDSRNTAVQVENAQWVAARTTSHATFQVLNEAYRDK